MDALKSSRNHSFISKTFIPTPGYCDTSRCDDSKRVNTSRLISMEVPSIGQCRCRCVHARLQSRLILVTLVISVVAVLLGIYALTIHKIGGLNCGLSEEDKHLLHDFRSLKSVIVEKNLQAESLTELVGSPSVQNGKLPVWKQRVKRQAKPKRKKGKRNRKGNGKGKGKGKVRAAHYIPKFWKDRNVEEYGDEGPIKFFHEADWLHKSSNILTPAKQHSNGSFEILDNGLYLLYSSVLFYDSKKKQSQAIVKNGNRLFKCMEGVDYLSDGGDKPYNSKYKSCSVTGVTYLKKGDQLTVGNLYDNTIIDMSEDSTFFGIVQLVPGVKTRSRKAG